MGSFKDVRECLMLAYYSNIISDDEFGVLYEQYKSANPEICHWRYEKFDLDEYNNSESWTMFRFDKEGIRSLVRNLDFPAHFHCYNNVVVDSEEALCIFLMRFAYPCRYVDMVPDFGRPIPQLCIVSNQVLDFLYDRWGHLLSSFDQPWLRPDKLCEFAAAIRDRGASLDNCWGFVDGTVRPVSRPGAEQRVLYNGHKKVHAIKFQSVVAPNGMIANLFGPVEGRRHDSGMLAMSGLLPQLVQHSVDPLGNILCIYGDPAYPLRPQLQCPFRGARITQEQENWNKAMSEVRVSVEWIFGDIVNYFKFLDFKKNLKVGLSAVGKMYLVCALLHNARVCLYGNTTGRYFDLEPLSLDEYFL